MIWLRAPGVSGSCWWCDAQSELLTEFLAKSTTLALKLSVLVRFAVLDIVLPPQSRSHYGLNSLEARKVRGRLPSVLRHSVLRWTAAPPQRAQYPLIKEYTLNQNIEAPIISGIFLI